MDQRGTTDASNPDPLWFIQAETKFRISRITSEARKYELLLEPLPPKVMTEVRDILVLPLGETAYTSIKGALLRRLETVENLASQVAKFRQELRDTRISTDSVHLISPARLLLHVVRNFHSPRSVRPSPSLTDGVFFFSYHATRIAARQ
ncbi:hypothetical protein HPB49_003849 [Dermacentor silvarum]|uniref:Uncharacterized protein n=1 Tax=Dermacentor silvarum TaxID=543639 RepID=A0ACB8CPF5_DERSI|nr:hypothetical protein HPB49_003849 [Dermacentor silvarum]